MQRASERRYAPDFARPIRRGLRDDLRMRCDPRPFPFGLEDYVVGCQNNRRASYPGTLRVVGVGAVALLEFLLASARFNEAPKPIGVPPALIKCRLVVFVGTGARTIAANQEVRVIAVRLQVSALEYLCSGN
jgi:hypothetical protein